MIAAVGYVFLSACTTTGDPTAGGIFWSPAKAQARQTALMNVNSALQDTLSAESTKSQSLVAQRESLRVQIAAKKAELARATTPTEIAALNNELISLQRQLAAL